MQREATPVEEEEEVAGSSWRQPLARTASMYCSELQHPSYAIPEVKVSRSLRARLKISKGESLQLPSMQYPACHKKFYLSVHDAVGQASVKIDADALLTSLSWQGDVLLGLAKNSTAYLFRGASASGIPRATTYQPAATVSGGVGVFGAAALSRKLETGLFVTTQRDLFHVWNAERPAEPLLSKQATRFSLSCASWSSEKDIFALGDTAGRIRLLDTRVISSDSDEIAEGRSTAWFSEANERSALTSIAWSPFIPSCFAASTDGGMVHFYDLRFGASALLSVGSHLNGVCAAAFSPHNAELLYTGGADARWTVLSLSAAPHCVVATSTPLPAPVIAIGCPDVQFRCHVACANGSIATLSMQDSLISAIVPSRFPPDAVEERAIENCIYRRDFNTALDRVAALSQKYAAEKRLEQALPLLQPLKCEAILPSIDAVLTASADRGSEAQKLRMFLNDVSVLASSLPPSLASRVDQRRMERAMAVKWAAQLLSSVKQEKLSLVVGLLPEVVSRLSADPRSLESGAVLELMSFLLQHDHLRGLALGAQLAAIFVNKTEAWPGFIPALHLLLFPTLWDLTTSATPPSSPPAAFVSYASLHRQALAEQLTITHKLMSALWTRGDPVPHIPSDRPLLSAAAARMALHALLRANQFEHGFVLANEQLSAAANLPSLPIFVNLLIDFFFPQFARLISAVNNPAQCGPLLTSLVYFTSKFPAITRIAELDEQLNKQVRRCAAAARERLKDMSTEERTSASAALRADLGSSFEVEKVREPHKRTLVSLMKVLSECSAGRVPLAGSRKRRQVQGMDASMRGAALALEASGETERSAHRKGSSSASSSPVISRSNSATKLAQPTDVSRSPSATKISRTPSDKSDGEKRDGSRIGRGGSAIEQKNASDTDDRSDKSSKKSDEARTVLTTTPEKRKEESDSGSVREKKEKKGKEKKKKDKSDESSVKRSHKSADDASAKEKKEKKEKKSSSSGGGGKEKERSKDDEGSERSGRDKKSHKKTA